MADLENDLDHVTPAPEPVADIRDIAAAALETQREEAPAGETAEEKADRLRDKIGRFATPEKAVERAEKAAQPAAPEAAPKPAQAAPEAPAADAPAKLTAPVGWSPAAKAVFDKADPAIQAAVAKREEEVNAGFRELQDWKPIKPFHDLLKQHGRDLPTALRTYTEIDQAMSRDVVGGLDMIAQNVQMPAQVIVKEWARRLGFQLTRGDGSAAGDPAPAAQAPTYDAQADAFIQRLAPIEEAVQGIFAERRAQELRQAENTVVDFWADPANKYAENVAEIMADLIKRARAEGRTLDLKPAYEQACYMHPEVRELLINERIQASNPPPSTTGRAVAATPQARAAAKATVGAPSPGFNPGSAAPQFKTAAEAARYAYDQQRGGL